MKVFVDVGVSLDGYIAGPNRGPSSSPLATHIQYAITRR